MNIITRQLAKYGISISSMLLLSGAAGAQEGYDVPLYDYVYFSDSTYSIEVGFYRDTCNAWGVGQTALQGQYSDYRTQEIYARCVNGQLEPY